jgi:hypothetical protein
MGREAVSAKILLAQPLPLEHGASGAVEDQDPLRKQPAKSIVP